MVRATFVVATLFALLLLTAVSGQQQQWKSFANGVAADEGNGVGDFNACDVECCKQKCDANPECNSFAASSRNCYLKDKCIFDDTEVKRSAYKTWYKPCPNNGFVESTCGAWLNIVSRANHFDGDVAAAVTAFVEWQNCIVAAKQDGQTAKKGLKFAVFRPTRDGASSDAVAAVAGRLQGLLSTFAFAMVTGRIFIVDWPELSSGNHIAFKPLHEVVSSSFQDLKAVFDLHEGGRLATSAVRPSPGSHWLCGTDLQAFNRDVVLEFSAEDDFIGRAAYNPAIAADIQQMFGPRSLQNNIVASLFSALLVPTASTQALLDAIATKETVGVLLDGLAESARSDDSDGVLEAFSASVDSLLTCAANAALPVSDGGQSDEPQTRTATGTPTIVVIDPDPQGALESQSGILVGSKVGQSYEFTTALGVDSATTSQVPSLQKSLQKISLLSACQELLVAADLSQSAGDSPHSVGFGLSSVAPVTWIPHDAAPHRPPVVCARATTSKHRYDPSKLCVTHITTQVTYAYVPCAGRCRT